ncbi:S1 family peptidase [Luteipulveratus mongoliensis]|uniref:Secretion protein n=1 Tax=Luteipulveratus mongoliensis TaxID=571913 RepID=A0A0K1JM83_9MICO|nr:S1 family peptidase [Luteipulveratus mongoliensis]AKU17822.1 secretion protein [Luteipulveratus mongoliensis]
MSRTLRAIVGTAGALALSAAGVTAAHAAPTGDDGPRTSNIVGGSKADSPYIVQLVFKQDGGTYGCTGEAISAGWVLTAKHCVDGTTSMNVYYSNDTANRGEAVVASDFQASSSGDVGLVKLGTDKELNEYAPLADSYSPSGGTGEIWGYGLRADKQDPDWLYKATVNIDGASTDAYDGKAVHVLGEDGASNHGDSGGPLFVDGKIVGVCSTGDTADPGSDIHAGSNYANLTDSRSWIKSTSGV